MIARLKALLMLTVAFAIALLRRLVGPRGHGIRDFRNNYEADGLPPVTAGSFSVLESRATGAPDVVYLENKTRVFFLDSEAEVQRYGRAFDLLSRMALGPDESLALIVTMAADL